MKAKNLYSFLILTLLSFILSCSDDDFFSLDESSCYGEKVLYFQSFNSLQNEYNIIYNNYTQSQNDESVLDLWESNNNQFYSSRKKENDMMDGIIPVENSYGADNFTDDEVFQTFLNIDGVIQVNNDLYLWTSGCTLFKIDADCSNYIKLVELKDLVINATSSNPNIIKHIMDNNIEMINYCDNPEFDFESQAIYGTEFNTNVSRSSECSSNYITAEIINNDPITEIIKYSVDITTIAAGNTYSGFYIQNSGNANITIVGGDIPSFIYSNLPSGDEIGYPGKNCIIEVDYSNATNKTLSISGVSFSGGIWDNCPSYSYKELNFDCPLVLNFKPIDLANQIYNVSISGYPFSYPPIQWDFSKTETIINQNNNKSNMDIQFCTNCSMASLNINAFLGEIPSNLCQQTFTMNVPIGPSCNSAKVKKKLSSFWTSEQEFNGKHWRLVAVLKPTGGGQYTKIKYKMKYRNNTTKYIDPIGNINREVPDDDCGSICTQVSLSSILPGGSQNGKKNYKIKKTTLDYSYNIDLSSAPEVKFTTGDGFYKTLILTKDCKTIQ